MRVVVAEDLFLLRDGLVRLVEAHGHQVLAAVATGPATPEALVGYRPDVAIVDVRLPPTFSDEGLQAALAARREIAGLPVLILSQHVEQLYCARAPGRRARRGRLPAEGPRPRRRPVHGRLGTRG